MPDLSTTLPAVLSVDIETQTGVVALQPTLNILFNQEMLVSSLNTDNLVNRGLTLIGDSEEGILLEYLNYLPHKKVLQVRPAGELEPDTLYRLIVLTPGFLGANGRPVHGSLAATFRTTASEDNIFGDILTPISPAQSVALTTAPVFEIPLPQTLPNPSWIQIEVSDTPQFNNPLWSATNSLSGSSVLFEAPPNTFLTDKEYFWRGRYDGGVTKGPWSPVYNFYYGTRPYLNQESQRIIGEEIALNLVSSGFEDGLPHQANWPEISFTFTNDIPSGQISAFSIIRSSIETNQTYSVSGDWTISGSTVTFTPGEDVYTNSRYTVTINQVTDNSGNQYSGEYYFSGPYTPLYGFPLQIRSQFGTLASGIPDDLLYYHLWRASLDANYRSNFVYNASWAAIYLYYGPRLSDIKLTNMSDSYPVQMWVIYAAMIKVLEDRIYNTIPGADGSLQIGDYKELSSSSTVLKFLEGKIRGLKQEQKEYEAVFSRRRTQPRTGLKSGTIPYSLQDASDKGYGPKRSQF